MKAAVYRRYGRPKDVLSIEDVARPAPASGEMLIRVEAASLNSWDWDKLTGNVMGRLDGLFGPANKVLGADIAGFVEAVGEGVTGFAVGDAVFGDLTESGWGGLAEYAIGKPAAFARKPAALSFAEAATIPQAGLLALQGLRHRGIAPGDHVLINGGGGGMGSFAIQIAKHLGAEVTGVDAGHKLELMRGQGADHVIDSDTTDFSAGTQRYDLVLDAVASRSLRSHLGVLKRGGAYVVAGGRIGSLISSGLLGRRAGKAEGKYAALLFWRPNPADMLELAGMIVAGAVSPAIDRVVPLADTAEALGMLGARQVHGKIVVAPQQPPAPGLGA